MVLTTTGSDQSTQTGVWNRQDKGCNQSLVDGNHARGRKPGPSDPSFKFSLVLVPQVAVNRITAPGWAERTHNELLEANAWSAPWISSYRCIYVTPWPDSPGLQNRVLFLSLVSRWEREAVSSGKVAAGLWVEQATEHTDPESIPTTGSSLMYMKFMFDSLPRDSSPIFPL